MHFHLVVYLLVFSIFLINVVISIEPVTMGIGAAVIGAGYWLFGKGDDAKDRRNKLRDSVDPCSYYECCTPKYITYDIEGLKVDLQKRLFGQHIVNTTLIPALRAHIKNLESSEKPLVMSFHGTMGTGKNHVSDLIVEHFYKYGEDSKYVHRYYARKDFPIAAEVEKYRTRLIKEIEEAVQKCKRSIFVFDEVEKMPVGVFESIASILDYHSHVGGTDFRQAIFIFLTNAGGDEIANALNGIMSRGTFREQTKIQDFEYIAEMAAYNIQGGLKSASMITSGLIDHFLPFLPLERRHIESCVRAEFKKINQTPKDDDVSYIVENYVSYQGLFSKYGCKRLNKKVQAMIEECYDGLCNPDCVTYIIDGLKLDLEINVFGQHIAIDTLIPALQKHLENRNQSKKPLIFSFNGPMGTGKSYVVDLIVKNLYKDGVNSKNVHMYYGRVSFPSANEIERYRAQLVEDFHTAAQSCEPSMFIFDDVDKMPAGMFETITSVLDEQIHSDSNDIRQAIVIFLSNVRCDEITNTLDGLIAQGRPREQSSLTDFQHIFEASNVIDHYLPFLPLERRHVAGCVQAVFRKLDRKPKDEDVSYLFEKYVPYDGLFAKYGCHRLIKRIQAMVEEW